VHEGIPTAVHKVTPAAVHKVIAAAVQRSDPQPLSECSALADALREKLTPAQPVQLPSLPLAQSAAHKVTTAAAQRVIPVAVHKVTPAAVYM